MLIFSKQQQARIISLIMQYGGVGAIADGSVTYIKIQNVSTGSRLLGRGSGGSGVVQEITLGNNLSMSGTTLNTSSSVSPSSVGLFLDNDTVEADSIVIPGPQGVQGLQGIQGQLLYLEPDQGEDGQVGPPGVGIVGPQGAQGIQGEAYKYLDGNQYLAADTRPSSEQRIFNELYLSYAAAMANELESSNKYGFELR